MGNVVLKEERKIKMLRAIKIRLYPNKQQAQAFNNLHDIAERESVALGQVLKFPQGVIPSLMSAHLPALFAEIQQSKITENIRSENQTDDNDWNLTDSALMKLLFFDFNYLNIFKDQLVF